MLNAACNCKRTVKEKKKWTMQYLKILFFPSIMKTFQSQKHQNRMKFNLNKGKTMKPRSLNHLLHTIKISFEH